VIEDWHKDRHLLYAQKMHVDVMSMSTCLSSGWVLVSDKVSKYMPARCELISVSSSRVPSTNLLREILATYHADRRGEASSAVGLQFAISAEIRQYARYLPYQLIQTPTKFRSSIFKERPASSSDSGLPPCLPPPDQFEASRLPICAWGPP